MAERPQPAGENSSRTEPGRTRRARARLAAQDAAPGQELNIVPYLDIITNLVMFLLQASVSAVSLGEIAVRAPTLASDDRGGPSPTDTLLLTVVISQLGFTVAGASAVLPAREGSSATIPRTASGLDYPALTRVMSAIHHAQPQATRVFLVPEDGIPYDVLVSTIDALREDGDEVLFPDVTLAGLR